MPANTRELIERFYFEVWNKADEVSAQAILSPDLRFRGSIGEEKRGVEGFNAYMRAIHSALGDYTCNFRDLVVDGNKAAALMTFEGRHQGLFFGKEATGQLISWTGAAFFTCRDGLIADIWVLGDVDAIKRQLEA